MERLLLAFVVLAGACGDEPLQRADISCETDADCAWIAEEGGIPRECGDDACTMIPIACETLADCEPWTYYFTECREGECHDGRYYF